MNETNRLRGLVAKRCELLANSNDTSATKAKLAHLRANLPNSPGIDPTIIDYTISGVSPNATGDEPTKSEVAVHLAMTLFATHQQSQSEAMQANGIGFGQAVAILEARNREGQKVEGTSPERRRFDAAVTSTNLAELAYHLRGLIGQLRAKGIGLDYGLLAGDLYSFQFPGGADSVRRKWARQFYRLESPKVSTTPTNNEDEDVSDSSLQSE